MTSPMHDSVKRWRANNPTKAREQGRKAAAKFYEWRKIATEFLKIMISDEIIEKRGRPKKINKFKLT